MRLIVRAGAAQDPKGKPGVADARRRRCSTRARRRKTRRADRRRDRLRSAARSAPGAGTDLSSSTRRHEGQLRRRRCDLCPTSRGTRVRARGDRAAAAADAVGAAGQLRGSGVHRRTPCSTGWSTASIPTACRTAARRRSLAGDHARRPRRVPPALLRAEQRDSRDRRRRHRRGGVRRRREGVRRLGSAREVPRRARSIAPPDRRAASSSSTSPTPCRRRSASATSAIPRKHPDYHGARPGRQDPRRRGRATGCTSVLRSERGLTYGASGRHGRAQETRRLSSPRPTRGPRRPAKRCG